MKKYVTQPYNSLLISTSLTLIALVILGADALSRSMYQGQAKVAVIEKENFSNEPLELVELKATDHDLKLGEKFSGDGDWLKKISFKLKNRTDKPIVHLALYLQFPETTATGLMMSYTLQFGQRPKAKAKSNQPIFLMKGDAINFKLSEEQYEEMRRFIETRQPLAGLSKVVVNVPLVYFADGTVWSAGTLYRPDSTAPGGMRPVDGSSQN
jgi:hypothetical protein